MKNGLRTIGIMFLSLSLLLGLSGCSITKQVVQNEETQKSEDGASKKSATNNDTTSAFQPAIPIQLKDMEGNTVSLESYKGKFVLVNFWASWCKYCDQEMLDLAALQKANDDLVILAVNVNETPETVADYLKKKKVDLKVLLDSEGEVAEAYYVSSMPTSYFIDRNGMVIGYLKGMMTAQDMDKAMSYLREKDTAK